MAVLAGEKVAIFADDGFEQVLLAGPREAPVGAGAQALIVPPGEGDVEAGTILIRATSSRSMCCLVEARDEDSDALIAAGRGGDCGPASDKCGGY